MRTYSTFIWELDDTGKFSLVEAVPRHENYDGPIAEAKKGRETVEQNAAIGQGQGKANNANSTAAFNSARGLLAQDEGSTTPGSLSPAAQAQLASDRDNISRTYNGLRQNAFATMGERGLSSAPSGFRQVAENAANQGEANAETGAYRNAQTNTQAQRNFATQQEGALAGQQGNLGVANIGQSTEAAVDRSKMGSTTGDILGGIAEAAPIIAAPFTGGASLIPALAAKQFASMGQKNNNSGGSSSSVGGYNPQNTSTANGTFA